MIAQVYVNLMVKTLVLIILFSSVPLGVSLLTGLFVAVFQSVTQIQEQTLSFVPRFLGVSLSLLLFGPFIATELSGFMKLIFQLIGAIK
ncbi:MAG: flagellar biosynthetic protein FliQ [Deltaproteobacteria bacterium]|nr:flagellar biosynthetic protein FliQ [Deltaproteobacteria bacterium]